MLFSQVTGQLELKKKLIHSVQSGRIPHAQLFFGPDGSGSLAMAIAYAQYVACENRTDMDSCGQCANCRKISKLTHADLHFSFPVNTTNKATKEPVSSNFIKEWREFVITDPYFNSNQWYEWIGIDNKQGLINKKESEEIIKKLSFKSFESEYKFMIIWLPEKMNNSSANVLLKLIEEPPEKTLFILVSDQPEQLLATITSRTQAVKLSGIDNASLTQTLKVRYDLSKEELAHIVRLARGSYIKAREIILTSEENQYNFEQFVKIMRLCYVRNFLEINSWVEEMSASGREKLKNFLGYSLKLVRENFILNMDRKELNYLTTKEMDFSKNFHPYINGNNIQKIYEEFNKASLDIERNAYSKIVLFDMALHLVKLIPNKRK